MTATQKKKLIRHSLAPTRIRAIELLAGQRRRPTKDWENLNRTALAFLRLNPAYAPKTL
jgi:hypothetical protein